MAIVVAPTPGRPPETTSVVWPVGGPDRTVDFESGSSACSIVIMLPRITRSRPKSVRMFAAQVSRRAKRHSASQPAGHAEISGESFAIPPLELAIVGSALQV